MRGQCAGGTRDAQSGCVVVTWHAEVLIAGRASGAVLRLDAPISFWGGVEAETSEIVLAGHPQKGKRIADTMLVIPHLIGSSSSSAVMLELLHKSRAPSALILGGRDAILPVGVVVAGQMGWATCPVVVLRDPPFRTGERISLDRNGLIVAV